MLAFESYRPVAQVCDMLRSLFPQCSRLGGIIIRMSPNIEKQSAAWLQEEILSNVMASNGF